MAIRAGMTELVARLRILIGDPAGGNAVFTDEDLEAFLDERRTDVDLAVLRGDSLLTGSPTTFRAPRGWWEADAVLAASSGVLTAGDESDPLRGVWVFDSAPSGAVYISGRYFDMWGSAAAALEAWAAKLATQFDFASDNQRFDRSQKHQGLLRVAREYSRKATSPGMRSSWGNPTWSS